LGKKHALLLSGGVKRDLEERKGTASRSSERRRPIIYGGDKIPHPHPNRGEKGGRGRVCKQDLGKLIISWNSEGKRSKTSMGRSRSTVRGDCTRWRTVLQSMGEKSKSRAKTPRELGGRLLLAFVSFGSFQVKSPEKTIATSEGIRSGGLKTRGRNQGNM